MLTKVKLLVLGLLFAAAAHAQPARAQVPGLLHSALANDSTTNPAAAGAEGGETAPADERPLEKVAAPPGDLGGAPATTNAGGLRLTAADATGDARSRPRPR